MNSLFRSLSSPLYTQGQSSYGASVSKSVFNVSSTESTSEAIFPPRSSYQRFSEKTTATVFPSSAYSLSSNEQYSIPTSSRKPPSLKPPTTSSTSSVSSSRLLALPSALERKGRVGDRGQRDGG